MQYALKKAMASGRSKSGSFHPDITQQYDQLERGRQNLIRNSFSENDRQKYVRLAAEFETCNDIPQAEKQYVNYLILHPDEADMWYDYAQFALRNGMQIKAEQFLRKACEIEPERLDTDMNLVFAAL
jgi:tetratricopeptide (TPR) repeat protein